MRVLLTGGTGYIGFGGSRRAACAPGTRSTRSCAIARRRPQVQARGAPSGASAISSQAARPTRRWRRQPMESIHAALDDSSARARARRPGARHVPRRLARGPAASSSIRRASGCSVRRRTPSTRLSPLNPIEQSAWRAPHEQRVLEPPPAPNFAPSSSARASFTAARRGIVGDLFKSAANGLVRVIGTGENHWPLVYDRDLGDLYLLLATNADASGVFHANDECDERSTTSSTAIAGHVSIQPSVRKVPSDRSAGRRWAPTRTRWRSTRLSARRALARSAGRRRCTPCRAMPRGCSRSGGEAGGGMKLASSA